MLAAAAATAPLPTPGSAAWAGEGVQAQLPHGTPGRAAHQAKAGQALAGPPPAAAPATSAGARRRLPQGEVWGACRVGNFKPNFRVRPWSNGASACQHKLHSCTSLNLAQANIAHGNPRTVHNSWQAQHAHRATARNARASPEALSSPSVIGSTEARCRSASTAATSRLGCLTWEPPCPWLAALCCSTLRSPCPDTAGPAAALPLPPAAPLPAAPAAAQWAAHAAVSVRSCSSTLLRAARSAACSAAVPAAPRRLWVRAVRWAIGLYSRVGAGPARGPPSCVWELGLEDPSS